MQSALLSFLLAVSAVASPKLGYETFARLHARLLAGETAARLEDELPRLRRNLAIAERVSAKYWTDCTVFDELAKAEILPEKAMKGLGIRRDVTGGVIHAPAGVMHTYGYLFSQLKTAYGLKGKRWLESRLDERLGLPPGAFSPLAPEGEFAANLTSVLLQVIGAPARVSRAASLETPQRTLGRVEQRVTWKTPAGETVKASVFTHLAPLMPLPGFDDPDHFLLIHEVLRDGEHRFTTAFPVNKAFADSIIAVKPGTEPVFKPRFNLYVDPSWAVVAHENLGWRAL